MKTIFSKQPILLVCSSLCVSSLFVSCGEKPAEQPKAPEKQTEEVVPAPEVSQIEEEVTPVEVVEQVRLVDAQDVVVVEEKVMTSQELKELRNNPWELKDLKDVRVHPGSDSPKVGDTIYSMKNFPQSNGTCGEFWVQDPSGYVSKLAVCSPDPNDENHTH